MNQKVLFIRTTERCNANCFMCNYAGSKVGHTLSIEEMTKLIDKLKKYNYKLIRFTGGEPLLNNYLKDFIKMLKKEKYKTSVITNGFLLPNRIDELARAGLDQIIISIDGADSELNDKLRGVKGIFDRAIEGIKIIKEKYPKIHVRVNTVVSNLNINSLCQMNDLFISLGVDEWALTPLKEDYNCYEGNEEEYIKKYKEFINYVETHKTPKLIGYSKYWGGRTEKEIKDLFYNNVHFIPNKPCELVNLVSFYIPSKKLLLPCNSLGHRIHEVSDFVDLEEDMFEKCAKMAKWLRKCGQKKCSGCSPINVYLTDFPKTIDEDMWGF